MHETALRRDALTSTPHGFELRVGLPWIRSMPLASVLGLSVAVDGVDVAPGELHAVVGSRSLPAGALEEEGGWWFVQDRLVLSAPRMLAPGSHAVSVEFRLLVPYLQAGPDAPLILPFRLEAQLELDAPHERNVSRDVA